MAFFSTPVFYDLSGSMEKTAPVFADAVVFVCVVYDVCGYMNASSLSMASLKLMPMI